MPLPDALTPQIASNDLRMYVLVNKDTLPVAYAAVQGAHALHTYLEHHFDDPITQKWLKEDKTLIFLEASENDIKMVQNDAIQYNIPFKAFKEPDLNDMMTACAFRPMTAIDGKFFFNKFKLLS